MGFSDHKVSYRKTSNQPIIGESVDDRLKHS
jgi:hypothetical protein